MPSQDISGDIRVIKNTLSNMDKVITKMDKKVDNLNNTSITQKVKIINLEDQFKKDGRVHNIEETVKGLCISVNNTKITLAGISAGVSTGVIVVIEGVKIFMENLK